MINNPREGLGSEQDEGDEAQMEQAESRIQAPDDSIIQGNGDRRESEQPEMGKRAPGDGTNQGNGDRTS